MAASIIQWISGVLADFSYGGLFLLMAIDSVNLPVPSEVVLAFSGFLVGQGKMNLNLAVLVSASGGLFGSLISYALAAVAGRPLILRYGKFLLIHQDDLDRAERWLNRHGEVVFFFGRFIPLIRTFISLPAGLLRVRLWPFIIYTFLGSAVWSYFFIGFGALFGSRWEMIRSHIERLQWVMAGLLAAAVVWHVHRHVKRRRPLI